MKTKLPEPQYLTVKGRRMVLLGQSQFEELLRRADLWEPALPPPDADGNYPALEYASASIARGIVRARRKLGLSQADLARRAGIRAETLNRVEHGRHQPSVPTIAKIEKALLKAEKAKARA